MFVEEFIAVLRYCLVYPEKTAVERMLSFVAKFVVVLYCNAADKDDSNDVDEEENNQVADSFANGILEFLYKVSTFIVNLLLLITVVTNITNFFFTEP